MSPQAEDHNGNLFLVKEEKPTFADYHFVRSGGFGLVYQNAAFFFFGQILWLASYYYFFKSSYATMIWGKFC